MLQKVFIELYVGSYITYNSLVHMEQNFSYNMFPVTYSSKITVVSLEWNVKKLLYVTRDVSVSNIQ